MRLFATLVLLLFTLGSPGSLNAQISPQTLTELVAYYKNNINNLDPIEGVYDVNIESWGENAYRKFSPETSNTKLYIYKDPLGFFRIYDGDKCSAIKGSTVAIKRIGAMAAYNFSMHWRRSGVTDSKRIIMEKNSIFNIMYSIPDKELHHILGNYYQVGYKVFYTLSFIKTYPTINIHAEESGQFESYDKQEEWSGTGFALLNGYIATNFHVIENAKSILIQGINGDFSKYYNATVVAVDKYNDLALLQIDDYKFKGFGFIPYNIKTTVSEVGENIFVLGYPLISSMGDEIKLTTGIISSKTGFQGDISLYQISAPVQPGNSGGPLFDENGNLIGIVNAKHTGAENVGYAIKASYLRNLVENFVSTSILPNNNNTAGLPLTGKVKSLKNYIFIINCSSVD